jgi:hypothetical protein
MGFQKGHKDFLSKESRQKSRSKISDALKGKVASIDTRKKMSDERKGKPTWWMKLGLDNPMKGKKTSENLNHQKAMKLLRGVDSPAWKGGLPTCATCKKKLAAHKSILCQQCFLKTKRGENHHNWRGGITPLRKIIRESVMYKKWQTNCLLRDNYTCVLCKKRGGNLHVDHIKPFTIILSENKIDSLESSFTCQILWDTKNGRTLCIPCHKGTDTFGRKAKKYDTI